MAFSHNPSAYIVSLPAQVEQRGPAGELLGQVSYGYDASPPVRGDLLTASRLLRYPGSSDTLVTRTTSYWPNGNPNTVTDETGRTVSTTYETGTGYALFPQNVTNGAGEAVGYTWDVACGSVRTTSDPNGQTTTTTYDTLCRPVRTDGPAGSYVEQSYPDLGDPTQQRARTATPAPPGAGGVGWTESYFDGLGRTWKTVSRGPAAGQDIVVERRFDVRGLPEEVTEPRYSAEAERVTHYEYDALGRVTRVELPGERELLTSYEATSQTATDPDGKQATSRFDAHGRIVEAERSLNGQPVITQTRYDALGRRIGMTDPAGVEWTWAYDSLGRVREEWDPDAGHRTATYDKAGRPLTQTDAKGQTTTQSYEPLVGRLQSRVNASGTVNYTYSQARTGCKNVGRLTGMTHIVSSKVADTLELDYDALGRVWKQRRKIGATTYAVQKTLDAGGYLQSTTYPDGDVVGGLTYDGAGRLAAIPGITTALTYDALGRPLTRTNANSTQTTWSYTDPRGFLTQIQTSGPQGTVQDVQYTEHTDAGLLQRVTSPISGEGWSYAYDDLNHMTTATHLQNPAESQSFTYDAADRILTSSRYGAYSYPGAQQAHPHAPSSVNGTALVYDLNGNVTQAGTRSVVWNADNLPTRVTLGSFRTDFTYDGFGERLKKTSSQGTSLYPFGDDYEITGGVVTKYISVEGLGVIAKRVGNGPAGAVTYWIHTDRLGSIQAVTSIRTVVWRRTYRPFGETLGQSGSHPDSRGWIDQRNDPETGLTYLHARYFDPQLGTFLSPDPIGVAGGMNAYGYGFGDAVNGADRSGLLKDQCEETNDPYCRSFVSDPMMSVGMGVFLSAVSAPGGGIPGFSPALAGAVAEWEETLIAFGHGGAYAYTGADGSTSVTLDPVGVSAGSSVNQFQHMETGATVEFEWTHGGLDVAASGQLSVHFDTDKGTLTVLLDGRPIATMPATSGKEGCLNNPACAQRAGVGPITPGNYWLYSSTVSAPGFFGATARYIRTGADWGSFRAPLVPAMTTNTYGRTGFYLHGGIWSGSAGCIDVGGGLFGNASTRSLVDLIRGGGYMIPVVVVP